ncbi:peptidylprolyl isomerase [Elizabethkingia argentiflava]|uniref:Peptidylprolyl isomerase n=1 Tax=Elizabethkingia argenteiflava TaxID=2681556 RepID=A0A845PX87_9FLAO|nr:peptidylprolyl isomerase [Elizabethkingia argenteiflava]NAW50938.1 peptidylprolyl isomerase [Elizabethkingia argenteiflava]
MFKNFRFFFILSTLILALSGGLLKAQIHPGQLADGIAAVIGNEIVLESDIEEYVNMAKQQGTANIGDRCEILENIIHNKLLLFYAKKDTLIRNVNKELKADADSRYQQMLSGFSSEKDMLKAYRFRTAYELKAAIEKLSSDQYYQGEKYKLITKGVDITPSEVSAFYAQYKSQLPEVNEEVKLSRIMMYPKLTDNRKQEIIQKLKNIKADILKGASFEDQARIYSDDPGSAAYGGLITKVSKGMMVKPFEATALNLQEGEISDPVETEYGFHIIQLVRKAGKIYDVRHILIANTPNAQEIASAKGELTKIKSQIQAGKISFKEAALKYSDDKTTKFNAGVMTGSDGSDNLEKTKLDPIDAYQIAGLNKGEITDPYEMGEAQNKKKAIALIQVDDIIPAHTLSIDTDYERIKAIALNQKKNDVVDRWVISKLPDTFISINNRYKHCQFKTDWKRKTSAK